MQRYRKQESMKKAAQRPIFAMPAPLFLSDTGFGNSVPPTEDAALKEAALRLNLRNKGKAAGSKNSATRRYEAALPVRG